jgi:uncharacterized membrane protein YesL
VFRRPNDGLFDLLDRAAAFILVNLFWVLLSIPLVSAPAATAGLFATTSLWVRGKQVEVFQEFWSAARRFSRKATLIGVIDLLIAGLVLLNLAIFQRMDTGQIVALISQSATLFVGLTALVVNLYLWPLMVIFEDVPLHRLFNTSLKLVFAFPLWSLVMLVLALIPFVVSLLFFTGILVLATFSAAGLLINWGAWRIIRRYIPEALAKIEAQG